MVEWILVWNERKDYEWTLNFLELKLKRYHINVVAFVLCFSCSCNDVVSFLSSENEYILRTLRPMWICVDLFIAKSQPFYSPRYTLHVYTYVWVCMYHKKQSPGFLIPSIINTIRLRRSLRENFDTATGLWRIRPTAARQCKKGNFALHKKNILAKTKYIFAVFGCICS